MSLHTQSLDFSKIDRVPKGLVVSWGGFDGIHPGHQHLIRELVREAKALKAPSCLYIFDPLPFQVLKGLPFKRLFTIEETKELLKPFGLDYFCTIPFDQNFSKLSPEAFISSFIRPHCAPVKIIAGYDFSFGYKKKGDISLLKKLAKEHGFLVCQIEARQFKGQPISSSKIRQCLHVAKMEELKNLLGRPFSIQGQVIRGEARGQKLGFPTANLKPSQKELPPFGVYGGRAKTEGLWYKAVINIGLRPTFTPTTRACLVEVHLLSTNMDLYGKTLKVELDFFIRKEKTFLTQSKLKIAIQQDISKALVWG